MSKKHSNFYDQKKMKIIYYTETTWRQIFSFKNEQYFIKI